MESGLGHGYFGEEEEEGYDIRRGRFWVEGKGLSKGGEKGKVTW